MIHRRTPALEVSELKAMLKDSHPHKTKLIDIKAIFLLKILKSLKKAFTI